MSAFFTMSCSREQETPKIRERRTAARILWPAGLFYGVELRHSKTYLLQHDTLRGLCEI